MSDRLFDVGEIPEVPLFREPRPRRGARVMDERLDHDYPPEWSRCGACGGLGVPEAAAEWKELLVECRYEGDVSGQVTGPVAAKVTHTPTGLVGEGSAATVIRAKANAWAALLPALRLAVPCPVCMGMGSAKAMVRRLAGHRCERCRHPYMPKGDARMLGVEPSGVGGEHMGGRWSPCDELCAHGAPIRWKVEGQESWQEIPREQATVAEFLDALCEVEAEWRILTVHHLDGDKANLAWWNLAALCQRCHLEIQAKVVMERVYPHEHSAWFKPHAAGYYAKVYLGEDVTREQALERMDELLALERIA